MWATYNGPLVDAPGSYPGTSSYMGRANAFFVVLPYWKSFYESNEDGSIKDIRRDVNFVDYAIKWNKNKETQEKSHTSADINKNLNRYPGKWRREWMAPGFVDPNNTGVNYAPLRYADAVLMAAEAYNEIGNTTEAREALKDVMRFWLSRGCDGFRVDMAGSLVKNDEDQKGNIALWQNIRAFLDEEYPEAAMVSEWGEPYQSLAGGFHMDFLLHFGSSHYNDLFRNEKPFFSGEGDASAFVSKYMDSYERSERKGLICIPSGNHDMDRLARHIKGERRKLAFAFLLSMQGAPYI